MKAALDVVVTKASPYLLHALMTSFDSSSSSSRRRDDKWRVTTSKCDSRSCDNVIHTYSTLLAAARCSQLFFILSSSLLSSLTAAGEEEEEMLPFRHSHRIASHRHVSLSSSDHCDDALLLVADLCRPVLCDAMR